MVFLAIILIVAVVAVAIVMGASNKKDSIEIKNDDQ